jgi:sec-independent protein translocase protein TatA
MGSLSIWHWVIILLLLVLIFGSKWARNLATRTGVALRNFREKLSGAPQRSPDERRVLPDETDVRSMKGR